MSRMTLEDLRTFVSAYVDEARQAGAWVSSKDAITGLVEKCVKTFTMDDGAFIDALPELSDQTHQGFWEEYFSGLVPAEARIDDGSNDELAPRRPVFDEPCYSYPLLNSNGTPGIRFKTTVDDNYFDRYINSGNDAELVTYIIKKLYDSYFAFKYQSKRQLIGNAINKAQDANAGEAYTAGTTIPKCGHIYVENNILYIMKVNYTQTTASTLAQLETAGEAKIITADLEVKIAKPTDTATAEAFIKQVKNDVEKLTIGPSEGTSISGSTIGAIRSELELYLSPEILAVLDVDALAGAFHVDKLAIPAMIKVLPDFGNIDDSGVFGFLVDKRGLKLVDNYEKANATPVNGALYTNYFLHYGATGVISKHTAMKVYTNTGV